jgi:uncharacterized membrane protein
MKIILIILGICVFYFSEKKAIIDGFSQKLFLLSMVTVLILTFFSYDSVIKSGEMTKLFAGWPLKWFEEIIASDVTIIKPNIFDITNSKYKLDFFLINTVFIYLPFWKMYEKMRGH